MEPEARLQAIAEVWRELLGVPEVKPDDNFFVIGGHSIKAMQAVVRLRRVLDTEVQLADFFRAPVLSDFAELLGGRVAEDAHIA
ncbi:phosphopantetheine-binding protein [Micromonospora sp. NPDC051925]|uniref:phosphopantetheine-binding protein n=1 Tax=Micromonospora sp. NPDC051925 TaxID=3364288 RepID=UPI0037CCAC90